MPKSIELVDYKPDTESSVEEILRGLQQDPKQLPCKLLYDERGSEIYERITRLEEYYPTRVECAIMRDHVAEMVSLIGPSCVIIEYGSGSSEKTRILLDHLENPTAYIPIDISREHLMRAAGDIAGDYPSLQVLPVCGDYHDRLELPQPEGDVGKTIVYFPGSTIGNFHLAEAGAFLQHIREVSGPGGGLLIGVDLEKDAATLEAAYDDREGVTAAFNLNILEHLNRVFGTDFELEKFTHRAVYNHEESRVEMHLLSTHNQIVALAGVVIELRRGESIWTESSYKYSLEGFAKIAEGAGFAVRQVWMDPKRLFSVQYLTAA